MEEKILINEIFPDPIGADRGYEWLEIVNISEIEIDISNWEIQVGGVNYNRAFRFPVNSKIQPMEYLLICEQEVEDCDYYTSLIGMQNGRGKTDGVRILNNSSNVIDTVLYSKPNTNNLKNDLGDIEVDDNIINMPPEGYSIARRNFQDSNISILDFFVTNSPTPKSKNILPKNISLSEITKKYIELYSPIPPDNINQWYLLIDEKKVFLKNDIKENFWTIDLEKNYNKVSLYSPEDILVDSFEGDWISKNFSYCRINNQIEEEFIFCELTKGSHNLKKSWVVKKILDVKQIDIDDDYIVQPCVIYEYENISIISDDTFAKGVNCSNCNTNTCFIGELILKKNNVSDLYKIEEVDFKKIEIVIIDKNNYIENLNKVVKIDSEYIKSDVNNSYFLTNIGVLKTKKGEYSKSQYLLQGILRREDDFNFLLEYPVTLKKEEYSKVDSLENTGNPIILISFLIFLILFKILINIKYRKWYFHF